MEWQKLTPKKSSSCTDVHYRSFFYTLILYRKCLPSPFRTENKEKIRTAKLDHYFFHPRRVQSGHFDRFLPLWDFSKRFKSVSCSEADSPVWPRDSISNLWCILDAFLRVNRFRDILLFSLRRRRKGYAKIKEAPHYGNSLTNAAIKIPRAKSLGRSLRVIYSLVSSPWLN